MTDIKNLTDHDLRTAEFESFAQVLQYRAMLTPSAEAFVFYNENGSHHAVPVTYTILDTRARQIAARLSHYCTAGDRCLLLYKPSIEYIAAFFACLYAKVIAVPVFMPNLTAAHHDVDKLHSILNDCSATVILSLKEHVEIIDHLTATCEMKLTCLFSDEFPANEDSSLIEQVSKSHEIAFLQYTSGSTNKPKGVQITHKNLLTNTRAIQNRFNFQNDSKGVIWLPPYHDMGLIGGVLASIFGGIRLLLTPPITFIKNPLQWLKLISHYGGTISGGPNFAYELCVKQLERKPQQDFDLSSWKVAFCGAEPIRAETLRRFATTFAPYGFSADAFLPCYGLAESTLMVSCQVHPSKKISRRFNTEKYHTQIIEEADYNSQQNATELVSCGQVIPDHQVCIVDPSTSQAIQENQIGEIWVRGNSVANGYWNDDIESTKTFNVNILNDRQRGWLRTGDLGFFYETNFLSPVD